MNNSFVITSESVCDLSEELMERYHIKLMPLCITLGDKSLRDYYEVNPDMIYDHYEKTGELPKTTAANIEEYTKFFKELTKDGSFVIHFSLSGEMSSTFNNARLAALETENVYVIDSRNLSTGVGLLMLKAYDLAKSGMEPEKIVEEVNKAVLCVETSFVLDTLEFLHKGGRCSAVAALGANLLKLRPCIEVKNGVMGVGKKYRGKIDTVLVEYAKERLADFENIESDRIFVTNSGGLSDETINEIVDVIKQTGHFKEIFLTRAGSTISSHCGKKCLGVLFIRKSPIA